MGNLDFVEILVIIVVALIVYGKDLPDVARKAGSAYVQFKRKMQSVKRDIVDNPQTTDAIREVRNTLMDLKSEVRNEIEKPLREAEREAAVSDVDEVKPALPAPQPQQNETSPVQEEQIRDHQ